jgi:hypothetical protein
MDRKLTGKNVLDKVRPGLGWSSKRTLAATATQLFKILLTNFFEYRTVPTGSYDRIYGVGMIS